MDREITLKIDESWTKEDLESLFKFVGVRLETLDKKVLDPITGVIPTLSKPALEDYKQLNFLCHTSVQKWNKMIWAEHMWLTDVAIDLEREIYK